MPPRAGRSTKRPWDSSLLDFRTFKVKTLNINSFFTGSFSSTNYFPPDFALLKWIPLLWIAFLLGSFSSSYLKTVQEHEPSTTATRRGFWSENPRLQLSRPSTTSPRDGRIWIVNRKLFLFFGDFSNCWIGHVAGKVGSLPKIISSFVEWLYRLLRYIVSSRLLGETANRNSMLRNFISAE
jgi:hypothetical protein